VAETATPSSPPVRKPFWRSGTARIFLGLVLGVVMGGFLPADQHANWFAFFQFCSKGFLALIKGIIVPLLVATIITGIAQTGDLKAVGRMGAKSLLYFEIITTIALFLGLGIANWLKPGEGLHLQADAHATLAVPQTGWQIALHAFPSNVIEHAAKGDILPVVMFKYTGMIMSLTPLGVFGAMAYNVSHMASGGGKDAGGNGLEGWPAVFDLLKHYSVLVGSLYLSLFLLFLLVFVPIMLIARIPILSFLRHIREPAIMAYSTASSEAALPKLLEQMEKFGVPRRVGSFVIPTGYSFNLDGSTLYLVLASLTIAQAAKIEMSIATQVAMVFTFMLTSKGVAGVPRATLVIIAGTASGFGLPGEAGVAMILAVDEIMDMARSALNLTGNGLAACVIARWEGVFGEVAPEGTLDTTATDVGSASTGAVTAKH
jgi:proton glutamate symport protein